jgi:hypothetical protein
MNDSISDLKKLLNVLDCTQESIQQASAEFIKTAIKDETRMEDLVKLWNYYCLNKSNKLAFLYLANDIIQNSFFQNLKFHGLFLNHINDTFPLMYKNVNEKTRREMISMIGIWTERKIYEPSKMENLKKFLCVSTMPNTDTVDNPLFEDYLKNNKIKVSEKIKEFASNLDNFVKFEEKIQKLNEPEVSNKPKDSSEMKKLLNCQHKTRESILKNSADLIKKQNQVYFKHIYYLQEVDKLLEKINSFKIIHNKSDKDREKDKDNVRENLKNQPLVDFPNSKEDNQIR